MVFPVLGGTLVACMATVVPIRGIIPLEIPVPFFIVILIPYYGKSVIPGHSFGGKFYAAPCAELVCL